MLYSLIEEHMIIVISIIITYTLKFIIEISIRIPSGYEVELNKVLITRDANRVISARY